MTRTVLKRCPRCQQMHPSDDAHFYPDPSRAGGLSSKCRSCHKDHSRAYRAAHRLSPRTVLVRKLSYLQTRLRKNPPPERRRLLQIELLLTLRELQKLSPSPSPSPSSSPTAPGAE